MTIKIDKSFTVAAGEVLNFANEPAFSFALPGTTSTLVNQGTVKVDYNQAQPGQMTGAWHAASLSSNGNGIVSILNSAGASWTVNATVEGSNVVGIRSDLNNGQIVNHGQVTVSGYFAQGILYNPSFAGKTVFGGATIVNTGSITVSGNFATGVTTRSLDNSGVIDVFSTADNSTATAATLTFGSSKNSGSIIAADFNPALSSVAVMVDGQTAFANSGTIQGDYAFTTTSGATPFELTNTSAGRIFGLIEFSKQAVTKIVNDGLIQGDVYLGASQNEFLGASGTLTGKLHTGGGADLVTLGAEDNIVVLSNGADKISTGAGKDIVIAPVASTAASLSLLGDSYELSWGLNGSTLLNGVEIVRFTDKDVVLSPTTVPPTPTDVKPPTLVAVSPADDATKVAVGSNIVLTFSEPVTFSALPGSLLITGAPGTIIPISADELTISGSTVTINPTANLRFSMTYEIRISGAFKDAAGNFFDSGPTLVVANFTTAANPSSHDWNGDGKGDILWRDTGTGALSFSLTGAGGPTLSPKTLIATLGPEWRIDETGDFDGDGQVDLLWRSTAGEVAIWNRGGVDRIDYPAMDANWFIRGAADFNGDGRTDLAWHNEATGEAKLWTSTTGSTFNTFIFGNFQPEWKVISAGDFRGDNFDDILWRNSKTGELLYFNLTATSLTGVSVGNFDPQFTVEGCADITGDGTSDMLIRHANGTVALWYEHGFAGVGILDSAWTLKLVDDFNGDGRADALWRHTNGDLQLWTAGAAAGQFSVTTLGTAPPLTEVF